MEYLDPKYLIETAGIVGVIGIVFAESGLFFGFFLPGDSLLFSAGLLASQDYMNVYLLYFGCLIAAIGGDSVGYAFGHKVGPKLFAKEESLLFSKKYVERSQKFFEKHGKKTVILARFMPIVRTFAPILAGVGSMDYRTFLSYNIIGGFLWVTSMVVGGYWFGMLIPNPDKYMLPIIATIVLLSILPSLWNIWRNKNKS